MQQPAIATPPTLSIQAPDDWQTLGPLKYRTIGIVTGETEAMALAALVNCHGSHDYYTRLTPGQARSAHRYATHRKARGEGHEVFDIYDPSRKMVYIATVFLRPRPWRQPDERTITADAFIFDRNIVASLPAFPVHDTSALPRALHF